jgi:hypothetical protein
MLIHEVTGRIAFRGVVLGDPEVLSGKRGTLGDRTGRIGEKDRLPPVWIATAVYAGLLAAGFALFALRRHAVPDLADRVGVFDETVAPTVCTAAREVLAEVRLSVRFGVHLFYFTNTAVRIADADAEFPPPADESVLNRNLHACAVGKLLLAEKRDVDALLTSPLGALTQRTVTSKAALTEQLDAIRDQGVATQTGELRDGTACVAVPVRAPAGALVAALAMSGRAEQDELLQRQIHTLVECATRLSPLLA